MCDLSLSQRIFAATSQDVRPLPMDARCSPSALPFCHLREASGLIVTQKESIVQATASSATLIVNPIIESTFETFDLMMGVKCRKTGLALKTEGTQFYPVSAIIGLTGCIAGTLCLNFSKAAALEAVKRMVDVELDEISSLVCDTVGEFANVIAGSAKDRVSDLDLQLGIPTIIRGESLQIDFPSECRPVCVEFESDIGPFKIVFGFVDR